MDNNTTSKQLHESANATTTDNSNSSQLVEQEPIENTPFKVVGNENYGYFVALGNKRLTEPQPTKDEAIAHLTDHKKWWQIILNLIITLVPDVLHVLGQEQLKHTTETTNTEKI